MSIFKKKHPEYKTTEGYIQHYNTKSTEASDNVKYT